jgi:uncharacterized protein (TIGR03083 family)
VSAPRDAHALRLQELGAICYSLAQFDVADWDHDTYCEGWRVRDVVGHMLVGYTTPMPSMIRKLASKRFNVDRASAVESVAYGSSHTPAQLLDELLRVQRDDVRKGISRVIPAREGVVDHVIHHIDITRPLGRKTSTSPAARFAALDKIVTLGGFVRAKDRAKGLRFVATDLAWHWGEGPLVGGPSEDLLLALSGRPVGLAALTGAGVSTLRDRLAA